MRPLFLIILILIYPVQLMAYKSRPIILKRVVDGDTFTAWDINDKKPIRVRLAGIDCPELNQPWGNEAKIALEKLFESGGHILIKPRATDRYQRIVATLWIDNSDINAFLLLGGHCRLYPRYTKSTSYIKAQQEAMNDKRGVWQLSEEEQIAPWLWRKGHHPYK